MLSQHVDQVVPALALAQQPLQLQERLAVAGVDVQDLVQKSDALVKVAQLLLGVAGQLQQHRDLIAPLRCAQPPRQHVLQRRPVFQLLRDHLQRRQRRRILGRALQRLAIGLRRSTRVRQQPELERADARVQRRPLGWGLGEPRPLAQHVGELGDLMGGLEQARQLAQDLGVPLLGRAQRPQRGDRLEDRAQPFVQAGRLHQQTLARLGIELDRGAPLEDRRRARRIGCRAVVALERCQRVDVLGVGLEHAHVQALGRRPFAGRLLVKMRRPQRQLARRVRLGLLEHRLDPARRLERDLRRARDAFDLVERGARRGLLHQRAPERIDGAPGVAQLAVVDLGDAPQPVRALGAVVMQDQAVLVQRHQLAIVAARVGQRLEDLERPLTRVGALQQLVQRPVRARVLGHALERAAVGAQRPLGVVERAQARVAQRREEVGLLGGIVGDLRLARQDVGQLFPRLQLAQHAI